MSYFLAKNHLIFFFLLLPETCASLSDCSWSSPRLGCLTDGENTPGTRSQAQSSGDEKAVASPSMVVVQRPRGILFMKDKCLPSPFIVHINLPPGVRHSGLVQAKLYTNGAKDCTVLAEVAPVLTLTSTADGVPPVLQLVATFDALRFDCTTHNQPAFLCFEMSITHERETQPRVTSTPPSDPLIVCSHSTQLISAAGQLLRMAAFGAATQLAWVRFAAVLRAHFVDCAAVVRPLSDLDIDYVHERLDRPQFVSLADCNKLWTWLGNVLKAVYGRHGHAMWENGLLVGLAPPDRTARGLPPGTAVIGFSPAKGDLIAYISPKRGGPLVTCQGTVRRCIVDAIIGNSDATEIWIGATHSSIPKRSAGALAGLSSRREIPLDDGDEKDGERTRKSNTPM